MEKTTSGKTKFSGQQKIGKVVQIIGPVVDVAFPETELPEIYTAIRITSEGFDVPVPVDIVVEVEQHLGD
ncbi:MAG: hypothetical protein ACPLRA_06270, partial [Candidatus Saccharicenans sp.]